MGRLRGKALLQRYISMSNVSNITHSPISLFHPFIPLLQDKNAQFLVITAISGAWCSASLPQWTQPLEPESLKNSSFLVFPWSS